MTREAASLLGPRLAEVGPWMHYRFTGEQMTRGFLRSGDGAIRYQVELDGTPVGAITVRSPWLAGPYLQILALVPEVHDLGIGQRLLAWYEQTAAAGGERQAWLCVTGVNVDAQRFYRRHGWTLAATLPDLMRDGDDELLMRKQLG
jgi:ribosomal protein S18 acetylase RimI-like enzyme